MVSRICFSFSSKWGFTTLLILLCFLFPATLLQIIFNWLLSGSPLHTLQHPTPPLLSATPPTLSTSYHLLQFSWFFTNDSMPGLEYSFLEEARGGSDYGVIFSAKMQVGLINMTWKLWLHDMQAVTSWLHDHISVTYKGSAWHARGQRNNQGAVWQSHACDDFMTCKRWLQFMIDVQAVHLDILTWMTWTS